MGSLATTYTFVNATTASASEVNTNFSDIVNYVNARNSASSSWDALSVTGNGTILGTLTLAGTDVGSLLTADGWLVAGETWTYASATTFTISGDKTSKYNKGDKIKFAQGSTKYFYIIGVSYSVPDTTITVTGGSDYTIANSAIGSPYYSKHNSPNGFPLQFNWTPGYTGFSSNPTTESAKFSISAGFVYLYYKQNALGTSNANTFTMTNLPINFGTLDGSSATKSLRALRYTYDGSAVDSGWGSISGTTFTFQILDSDTGWKTSGTKGVWGFSELIPLP